MMALKDNGQQDLSSFGLSDSSNNQSNNGESSTFPTDSPVNTDLPAGGITYLNVQAPIGKALNSSSPVTFALAFRKGDVFSLGL